VDKKGESGLSQQFIYPFIYLTKKKKVSIRGEKRVGKRGENGTISNVHLSVYPPNQKKEVSIREKKENRKKWVGEKGENGLSQQSIHLFIYPTKKGKY